MIVLDHNRCALMCGDALTLMRSSLADKSVDIICTDPPYGEHTHAKLGKESRNDGTKPRDKLEFPPLTLDDIAALAREFVRISRGWITIFSDYYLSAEWGKAIERAGGAWVRTGQWVKTNPMPQLTGDRPACGAEDIVICHANASSAAWEWNGKGHAAIWRGPRPVASEFVDGEHHPNQKPEWLIQQLLGMFAPAGATVLDPFIGSGTAAVAAFRTERVPGDIPIDTSCAKCAQKRASEYAPPLPIGCKVIGIDGDRKWIDRTISRIITLLGSLHV